MGLTNVRSASNAWGTLKKKILAIDAQDKAANPDKAAAAEESTASTKATTKTPAKGKRAAAAITEGDADAEIATPTKKPRGRKPKAATATPKTEDMVTSEDGEKAEGSENTPINLVTPTVTPVKKPRGRAAAKIKAEAAAKAAAEVGAANTKTAAAKEEDLESGVKDESTVTEAKKEEDDVEELVSPEDVAHLEKIAADGIKAIKQEDLEEEDEDDGTI
ncbi:hypothetical protein QC762_512380 [Podospora pseudocomata]|uniref:Uncharacterized protein n=1 Tax=Podospora pseudocomata TaxID=2093779 RepID=A0ABR0GC54_9PEZI|nr:hypothetical protein QC762_512380 [Podospora pseudocomata]